MKAELKMEGAKELIKIMDVLKDEIVKELKKAIKSVTSAMVDHARQKAPVGETGVLVEEIIKEVRINISKGYIIALVGVKKGNAYYGYFVHEGTKTIKVKQPFILEAVTAFQDKLLQKIKEAVFNNVH